MHKITTTDTTTNTRNGNVQYNNCDNCDNYTLRMDCTLKNYSSIHSLTIQIFTDAVQLFTVSKVFSKNSKSNLTAHSVYYCIVLHYS